MPYQLPEVPETEPKTFEEYMRVVDQLRTAQTDRSWLAVCQLLADAVAPAKLAARQAEAAQQAASAYIARWYPDTVNRLIDKKHGLDK